jgi:hypothetical protein
LTWYNYTPLAPLLQKYSDDGSRDLFSIECRSGSDDLYRVAATGRRDAVELIAFDDLPRGPLLMLT